MFMSSAIQCLFHSVLAIVIGNSIARIKTICKNQESMATIILLSVDLARL